MQVAWRHRGLCLAKHERFDNRLIPAQYASCPLALLDTERIVGRTDAQQVNLRGRPAEDVDRLGTPTITGQLAQTPPSIKVKAPWLHSIVWAWK